MKFEPRPYQVGVHEDVKRFFAASKAGDKRFYTSPTGTGKSIMEIMAHEEWDDLWIVSPREEILDGIHDKLGREARAMTPIKMRNRLLDGRMPPPGKLCFDEGHHSEAESWQAIMLLCGMCPSIGFSATAFRGSPRSTKEFLAFWGEPVVVMTYKQAVDRGYISMPEFKIVPLVDDDVIDVVGGEFEITRLEAETRSRMEDLVDLSCSWWDGSRWDRPTIFSLPSRATCAEFAGRCAARGVDVFTVDSSTPRDVRRQIFELTIRCFGAIAHVNVVTEGVDLPLRRLVDAQPIMSPVKWLQQLGRITRPTTDRVEYIGTNRNLLRHAHLLEGLVPVGTYVEAEKAFGLPSFRRDRRVLGLEALGRFKAVHVPLTNGLKVSYYTMSTVNGPIVERWTCIVHPLRDKPIWARRIDVKGEGGKVYGKWFPAPPPDGLQGFSSVGQKSVTEKQMNWWTRSARRFGLDPEANVNRKVFDILPVLNDIGETLR